MGFGRTHLAIKKMIGQTVLETRMARAICRKGGLEPREAGGGSLPGGFHARLFDASVGSSVQRVPATNLAAERSTTLKFSFAVYELPDEPGQVAFEGPIGYPGPKVPDEQSNYEADFFRFVAPVTGLYRFASFATYLEEEPGPETASSRGYFLYLDADSPRLREPIFGRRLAWEQDSYVLDAGQRPLSTPYLGGGIGGSVEVVAIAGTRFSVSLQTEFPAAVGSGRFQGGLLRPL